jgi:leader peptidase (prepilin peptidase)/N-methyltransferase
MTHYNLILIFGITAALASFLAIVPMVRLIPLQMITGWNESIIGSGNGVPTAPVLDDFKVSSEYKIAICVAGGVVGIFAALAYGSQIEAAMMCIYFLGLVLLVSVNLKHMLLPDVVVLTLLWIGLLYSGGTGNTAEYVCGAALGYGAPLMVIWLGKLFTRGDFLLAPADPKALAMAGAWFGMSALPIIFGVFVGVAILVAIGASLQKTETPTGPAHMIASLSYVIITRLS